MSGEILVCASAESRLTSAAAWLARRSEPRVTIVAASVESAAEVARRALLALPTSEAVAAPRASFGWQRFTLGTLAVSLARAELARRGLVPAFGLALEAVCARVVHDHTHRSQDSRGEGLGRFAAIGELPGLPRALARTVAELRLAGSPELRDADLARLVAAFGTELEAAGLADRARTFAIATELVLAQAPGTFGAGTGAVLLVDVPLRSRAERDFVTALATRAPASFAVVPAGDERTLTLIEAALTDPQGTPAPLEHRTLAGRGGSSALARLQEGLFGPAGQGHEGAPLSIADGREVLVLSAPGESREAVEIARKIVGEAKAGTRLDRMAVLLRAPQYAAHLEEALRRAGVPAHFARGTRKPDPAGRAMLALLACAAEGLSASRFAEYLSLGEVPDEDESGAPPAAAPASERVAPPDEEALAALLGDAAAALDDRARAEADGAAAEPRPGPVEEDRAAAHGTLRAPRHWERLLVDAAVIGGAERWQRRIEGLAAKLASDLAAYEKKAEDGLADHTRRDLAALESLRRFALPLVAELAALPRSASWGDWLDALGTLASRALRRPDRVLAVLAELQPMARVGPVDLTEVRLVLEGRLSQLVVRSAERRHGKVYVATIEESRGLAFDVVFIPGLAEKIFPQKVVEDPLLLDEARAALGGDLPTNDDRTAEERLALRLAVGAASRRVVFSYPRVDVEQARPRTPSFYGLEVLRVAEGELRDFHYLAENAAKKVDARIGWPAPKDRNDAIDEAEYDLALLESVLEKKEDEAVGEAHYLLSSNPHLARALRFRGRRWLKGWKAADGLVDPPEEALLAIREHALEKRSFSPTALQNFAACPYRFFLSAVHRLAPREEPTSVEDLDPLTRGSLVHEVQFNVLTALRDAGLLPVTRPRLEQARALLDEVLARVAKEEHDRLNPAIERVWKDTIEAIAADLREWLRRMLDEPEWTPAHFELSFGLKDVRDQDALSTDEPVKLDAGIQLRGSIDLVEKNDAGWLRATDHKTGKVRAQRGDVIKKGEVLQPVLYALTIEKLFPGVPVKEGRLYYCTAAGDFSKIDIPLTDEARAAAQLVSRTIGDALQSGFLPAAPAKDACKYCDYRPVCGPYEEIRTRRKSGERLKGLIELRRAR
ncbi:MAG: ATP-dependent nuclease, subunit [Labilithrix sp.]|nr:ATP-dependent nuclease, subunit [Labilithrix sp.]